MCLGEGTDRVLCCVVLCAAREIYRPSAEPSICEEREEHEDAHAEEEEEGAEEDEQELPSSVSQ